jgi:hypothetical protein
VNDEITTEEMLRLTWARIRIDAGNAAAALLQATSDYFDGREDPELGAACCEAVTALCDIAASPLLEPSAP